MKSDQKKYSINFDLSTEELREHYSKEHPEGAYFKIRNFLEKKGYVHVQGSGYHSAERISLQKNYDVLNELKEKYEWIKYSVKSMYLTEIGERYDATYLCRESINGEHDESDEIKRQYNRSKRSFEIERSSDEYEC